MQKKLNVLAYFVIIMSMMITSIQIGFANNERNEKNGISEFFNKSDKEKKESEKRRREFSDPIKKKNPVRYFLNEREYKIPVLMYHSISNAQVEEYTISIQDFESQMNYLIKNNIKTVSLGEYTRIMSERGKDRGAQKYVLITFDDARQSQYDNALPILKKLKLSATFFVPTSLLNTETFMTDKQVRDISKMGFDIANHTVEHEWLPNYSFQEQLQIIKNCNDRLKTITGKSVVSMSYPYGQYNMDTVAAVSIIGMKFAFCSDEGISSSNDSPYSAKRLFIYGGITLTEFSSLLTY